MNREEKRKYQEKCKHCSTRVGRQRGLCGRCYDDKTVRIKYPKLENKRAIHSRRGVGFEMTRDLRGWEPTQALPGTEEKLKVLEDRASKGLPLWHPKDARIDVRNRYLDNLSVKTGKECIRLEMENTIVGEWWK